MSSGDVKTYRIFTPKNIQEFHFRDRVSEFLLCIASATSLFTIAGPDQSFPPAFAALVLITFIALFGPNRGLAERRGADRLLARRRPSTNTRALWRFLPLTFILTWIWLSQAEGRFVGFWFLGVIGVSSMIEVALYGVGEDMSLSSHTSAFALTILILGLRLGFDPSTAGAFAKAAVFLFVLPCCLALLRAAPLRLLGSAAGAAAIVALVVGPQEPTISRWYVVAVAGGSVVLALGLALAVERLLERRR